MGNFQPSHTRQQTNHFGGMVSYTNRTGKTYTGAGLLLLEQTYTRGLDTQGNSRPAGPVVILYRDKHSGLYADLGGGIESQDLNARFPLAQTAVREAFEESSGYIQFQNTGSLGMPVGGEDVLVDHHKYRAYVVCIPTGVFYQGKASKVLVGNSETDDVARFFLVDLYHAGILTAQGDFQCMDAHGRTLTIKGRTKALLRNAFQTPVGRFSNLIEHVLQHPKNVDTATVSGKFILIK